jgi:hypothetical protein
MHINRGLLFWGLALITAGAVALGIQQDVLDRDALAGAWRLWPVVLIAIGLSIILARTPFAVIGTIVAALVLGTAAGALISIGPGVGCGGDEPTDLARESGSFGGAASVDLEFNCGTLMVDMGDGSDWEANTGAAGDRQPRVDAEANALNIRSPEGGFNFGEGRQRWEVSLGSEVTYQLDASINAASATLDLGGGRFARLNLDPNAVDLRIDLSDARADDFDLSMNAGSARLQTDATTDLAGSISMNAGSLKLCTDDAVGLRFTVDANITFSHNLDDAGLTESGDAWQSDGFASAEHQIDIRLEGNAASFELNPEGGCS